MKAGKVRKLLVLPILSSILMLTSCNYVRISKPIISIYSHEIDPSEWKTFTSYFDELTSGDLFSFYSTVNRSFTKESVSHSTITNQQLKEESQSSTYTTKLTVNSDKELALQNNSGKYKSDYSGVDSSSDSSLTNYSSSIGYQIDTMDDGYNYFVAINKKTKVYRVEHEINEAYHFKNAAFDLLHTQYNFFLYLDYAVTPSNVDNNTTAHYYLDSNVYTAVLETQYQEELSSKNSIVRRTKRVFQYEFGDIITAKYTLKDDTSKTYSNNRVDEITSEEYFNGRLERKKKSLSKISLKSYERTVRDID